MTSEAAPTGPTSTGPTPTGTAPTGTAPTPPIALGGDPEAVSARLDSRHVAVDDALVAALAEICEVSTEAADLAETSRDWWPLAMTWALDGQVGQLAAVVARPADEAEVGQVVGRCAEEGVPVTVTGGRSGVCGGSVPLHGGVALDLTRLQGIRGLDTESLIVDVAAGTFGNDLEDELRATHGCTLGHWPQSIELSTVGGWLACRSAGQLSTRYGKIEDMVVGLDVVLADGSLLRCGGHPRQAVGPDLTQLFVGSEGTLGVITGARLRVHRLPTGEGRRAFGFTSFEDGMAACRRILQRGATPAVLRLYDAVESRRNFGADGSTHLLLVLDEADPHVLAATMAIVDEECASARAEDEALVAQWWSHRNDVSALESLISGGLVVDTMELSGPWSVLDRVYTDTLAAIAAVDGTVAVSAHQSHSYPDGACLYFTFGGKPAADHKDAYYHQVWDAGTNAALAAGGSLSHHHGVGLNRSRFVASALGTGVDALARLKTAFDPTGILNPGKMGLPDLFAGDGGP